LEREDYVGRLIWDALEAGRREGRKEERKNGRTEERKNGEEKAAARRD
jgi:hypothetical protein